MLFKAEEHERIEGESRLVRIAIIVNTHKPGFVRIDAGIGDDIVCHVVFSCNRQCARVQNQRVTGVEIRDKRSDIDFLWNFHDISARDRC